MAIQRVTVTDAARLLGCSSASVRRRLVGHKSAIEGADLRWDEETRPQGSRIWVYVPDEAVEAARAERQETPQDANLGDSRAQGQSGAAGRDEAARLWAEIERLHGRLDASERSESELRALLAREQAAHERTSGQLATAREQLQLTGPSAPVPAVPGTPEHVRARDSARAPLWRRILWGE